MSMRTVCGVRVPAAAAALLDTACQHGATVTQHSGDALRIALPGAARPLVWGWRKGSDSPAHVSNLRTSLRRAGALPADPPDSTPAPVQEDTMPRTRNHGATVAPEKDGSRAVTRHDLTSAEASRLSAASLGRPPVSTAPASSGPLDGLSPEARGERLVSAVSHALESAYGLTPAVSSLAGTLVATLDAWSQQNALASAAEVEAVLDVAQQAERERDDALERVAAAERDSAAAVDRAVERQRRAERERDEQRVVAAEALERATKAERRLAAFREALRED